MSPLRTEAHTAFAEFATYRLLITERSTDRMSWAELQAEYTAWRQAVGSDVLLSSREFTAGLRSAGATYVRTKSARMWHGVRLMPPRGFALAHAETLASARAEG